MKSVKILIVLLMLFQWTTMLAHEGHHDGEKHIRIWHDFENNVIAKGSFYLYKNEQVILVTTKGSKISLPIEKLSRKDNVYILQKVSQISALNTPNHPKEKSIIATLPVQDKSNYKVMSIAILILVLLVSGLFIYKYYKKRNPATAAVVFVFGFALLLWACSSDDDNDDDDPDPDPVTTVALAYSQDFLETSFSFFSNVGVTYSDSDGYLKVESNGIPDHQMMVGITSWIERVPIPIKYYIDDNNHWSIPLSPTYVDSQSEAVSITDDLQRGAIGIAANGIPIFNPYNASGEISNELGELDAFGGHSGNGNDYHYHTPPTHLSSTTGDYPIGFIFDGFPLYGTTETDGSTVTDLDEYFGHEDDEGYYHYHSLDAAPYMTPYLRGVVAISGTSPQTQIEPQALASTEHDLSDINLTGGTDNHEITGLEVNDNCDGYTLTYTTTTNNVATEGTIVYDWETEGEITFVHTTDTSTPLNTQTFNYSGDAAEVHENAFGCGDNFTLTSSAVENGELLSDYQCDDDNSIPLEWSNVPSGTTKFAIHIVHYPNTNDVGDLSKANSYIALWDIDASVTSIAAGQVTNDDWYIGSNKDGDAIGYTSPCSPDAGTHEYIVTIYALSETPSSLPTENSLTINAETLYDSFSSVTILGSSEFIYDSVTE